MKINDWYMSARSYLMFIGLHCYLTPPLKMVAVHFTKYLKEQQYEYLNALYSDVSIS